MIQPLRSSSITEPSSLLRVGPPLCPASVLSLLWGLHLSFSLNIRTTSSHVPCKSLKQDHAIFMPDVTWTVGRFPLCLSREQLPSPGFDVNLSLSTPRQWFAYARLLESHLTQSYAVPFPTTHTTRALYPCSLRWFEVCSCKPTPRGPPSSFT